VKAAAFFQRAMAHLAFQRRQEAVTDLTAAIENDPSLALAYLNRATILNTLGRTSEAIEDATRAIAVAPTLPAAFANRSWFYQGIGRFDEAVSDGTKAIGLSPTFAQAYTNRAWANFKRRHFDAAIADYAVSTSLDERNAGALRQLGLLKFYAGDFADSADSLAKALALDGDPYTALLLYISQARRGERSVNGLKERLATLKAGVWPFAIFELLLGTKTPDEALAEPAPAPLEVRLAKALVQNARKLATRSAASIARQLSQ
jgi:tetratricopeptide (TPR) repeat protein